MILSGETRAGGSGRTTGRRCGPLLHGRCRAMAGLLCRLSRVSIGRFYFAFMTS